KPTKRNLVDRVWGNERPAPPMAPVVPHPMKYAGRSIEQKIAAVQKTLQEAGHDSVVQTQPDSICWLLNIRGQDVAHNPVALCFAIVPAKGTPELFIDDRKLTPEAKAHLRGHAKVRPVAKLKSRLVELRKAKASVRIDPERTS